jgi:hypothetical protein
MIALGHHTGKLSSIHAESVRSVFAAAGQDDLGASVSESEGRRLANAGRSAGYQSNFVFVGIGFHDNW